MNIQKRVAENNIEKYDINQGNKKIKSIDCLNFSSPSFQLENENCFSSSDFNSLALTASSSPVYSISSPSRSVKSISPKKKSLKKKQDTIIPPTILDIGSNCKDDTFIQKILKNIEAFQIYQHCFDDDEDTNNMCEDLTALGEDYYDSGNDDMLSKKQATSKKQKRNSKSKKANKTNLSMLKYFL